MAKPLPQPSKFLVFTSLSLVVTGLGIGWLAGLSLSPVISIVITSVIGSAAAIIAALSGLEKPEDRPADADKLYLATARWQVNPLPLACLVIGLVAGASIGVRARTHDLLGRGSFAALQDEIRFWDDAGLEKPEVARRLFEHRYGMRGWSGADLDAEITRWATATGMKNQEIARLLFESSYSATSGNVGVKPVSAGNENSHQQAGVLFSVAADDCVDIQHEEGSALRQQMLAVADPQLVQIAKIITDTVALQQLVEKVLCAGG